MKRRRTPFHHRVAQRLGLISDKLAVGPAHRVLEAMLPEGWGAQEVYDHHEVMMFHGQRVCFFRAPKCRDCVLLDLCPTGRARRAGGGAPQRETTPSPGVSA